MTIEQVHELMKTKLGAADLSADLQRYEKGEFFFAAYKTSAEPHNDGFFLVAVPRKQNLKVIVSANGYRDLALNESPRDGLFVDVGEIKLYPPMNVPAARTDLGSAPSPRTQSFCTIAMIARVRTKSLKFGNRPAYLVRPAAYFSPLDFSCFFFGAIASADFKAGLSAYSQNKYQVAFREWLPLAEQGDALAQLYLARMYEEERGCDGALPRRVAGTTVRQRPCRRERSGKEQSVGVVA